MRTLLRHIQDRNYFRSPGRWTPNPQEALDFKSMSRAIEFVEQEGYRNVEVAFFSIHPRRIAAVRVDTLEGLEQ